MLRFLGRVYGYYPADPLQAYKVDSFVSIYTDVIGKFYSGAMTSDPDAKAQKVKDLFDTYLPKVLKAAEDQLKSNGGKKFLFGDRLNIADFWYGGIYTNYFNNPNAAYGTEIWQKTLQNYPTFEAYGKRFSQENARHLASRPKGLSF